MNNIALGRYMPLNSVVHKMDPRAKIMILLFLMIAVFIPAGAWGYVLLSLFILVALFLSKLQLNNKPITKNSPSLNKELPNKKTLHILKV